MPGTVKIWWHDGGVKDIRYHDIPVVNEPELSFETVAVSPTPALSGPAPVDATVAIVETNVNLRYVVRRPGDISDADTNSKPILALDHLTEAIGVKEGYTISFVEG